MNKKKEEPKINNWEPNPVVYDFVEQAARHGIPLQWPVPSLDMKEPFGAILWHRRTAMGMPAGMAAFICDVDIYLYRMMEYGWTIPREEKELIRILSVLSECFGLSRNEARKLAAKGLYSIEAGRMDLTEYLGVDTQGWMEPCRPKVAYHPKGMVIGFERNYVTVWTRETGAGTVLPENIIWTDGSVFPIQKILRAEQDAVFQTGGIGTWYECRIGGQRRVLGFDERGEWFVETPLYAEKKRPTPR